MTCLAQRAARDPYVELRATMRETLLAYESTQSLDWRRLDRWARHEHIREYCKACPDGYVYTITEAMNNFAGRSPEMSRAANELDHALFTALPGNSVKAWILLALERELTDALATMWAEERERVLAELGK